MSRGGSSLRRSRRQLPRRSGSWVVMRVSGGVDLPQAAVSADRGEVVLSASVPGLAGERGEEEGLTLGVALAEVLGRVAELQQGDGQVDPLRDAVGPAVSCVGVDDSAPHGLQHVRVEVPVGGPLEGVVIG